MTVMLELKERLGWLWFRNQSRSSTNLKVGGPVPGCMGALTKSLKRVPVPVFVKITYDFLIYIYVGAIGG